MKNANSLLRRVLALALACMLLAGCSSKQQPGSSEAASSGDSHSSSTESSAPDSSADVSGPDSSSGGNSSQSNSSSGKTTAGKGSTSAANKQHRNRLDHEIPLEPRQQYVLFCFKAVRLCEELFGVENQNAFQREILF